MVGIPTVVRSRRRSALTVAALGAATALLALTGCSTGGSTTNGSYGFPEAKQDTSSTITVWVDADRQAAAKAFEKANPDTKIKVVTYDGSANGSNSFRTKMQLFDRAGSGWPDVVFSSQNNDAAWASQKSNGKQAFAAVLDKGLVPKDTLDNFTEGALNPCTVERQGVLPAQRPRPGGALVQQDAAWTSSATPCPRRGRSTRRSARRSPKEHPGYIIGTAGDAWTPEVFMWASKCQANDITGPKSVTVKTDSDRVQARRRRCSTPCARTAPFPNVSVFTPEFVKNYTGKVLMMPGPAWYAGAIFNNPQSLNVPAGQLGVAAPLPWKGEDSAVTGNVGGGTWFISQPLEEPQGGREVRPVRHDGRRLPGRTSRPATRRTRRPPTKWIDKQESSNYFATAAAAGRHGRPRRSGTAGAPASSARRRSGPRR